MSGASVRPDPPDPPRRSAVLDAITMLPPDRIPIWSHWARRRFLERFRHDLAAYGDAVRYEAFPFRTVEDETARGLRRNLEERRARCRRILRSCGGVSLRRLAPAERAGEVAEVDLLRDVFELDRYNLGLSALDDALRAAEARYAAGRRAAWVRTFNPFYWVDMTLSVAADLPFVPLKLVGVSPAGAARSRPGRLLRTIIRIGVLVGGVWLGLMAAGWDDEVGDVAGRLFVGSPPPDAGR